MTHMLTEAELPKLRAAFTHWDVCKAMEFADDLLTPDLRACLMEHQNVENERIKFWCDTAFGGLEELRNAIAALDDGNGHVPLRDLMRILHEHMEYGGYNFTDGELVNLYRKTLDVSLFGDDVGSLSPGVMWRAFEEEFADLRRQGRRSGNIGFADSAGADGESASEAHLISVTVVDLGGKHLMSQAVASTWSVQALQQHIERVVGVPVHRQLLSLAGDASRHGLSPHDGCLDKAGVFDGSTLWLLVKDELKLDYEKFIARLKSKTFER